MNRNLSVKIRLALVLSVVWLLLVLLMALEERNAIGIILGLGVLPLTLSWGIFWVLLGRAKTKQERTQPSSPIVPMAQSEFSDEAKIVTETLKARSEIASATLAFPYHPWRRFFAKSFDIFSISYLFGSLLALSGYDQLLGGEFSRLKVMLFSILVGLVGESVCLAVFGTTLGKYFFGIHVLRRGEKLTFTDSINRTALSYAKGAWFFLPLFSLLPMDRARRKLRQTGTTDWDSQVGTTVTYAKLGTGRAVLCIVLCVVMYEVNIWNTNRAKEEMVVRYTAEAVQAKWQNPITMKYAIFPLKWRSLPLANAKPGDVSIGNFSDDIHQVMFMHEESKVPISLQKYATSLQAVKSKAMDIAFSDPVSLVLEGRASTSSSGTLKDGGKEYRVIIRTWTTDGKSLWHTTAIQDTSQDKIGADNVVQALMLSTY